ncbi:menaquinone biosynthetic enzyme MqnA/MqnD family protein [Pseudodesulfovibrio pelocollis]|uniref:menaquinone biosynthetic enzyme MqnA/MqnD family protein n=1 Tax=Pseudodesulfovibrio pelocollis TaxID=3051432 RepID=UPI00255A8102|nr:menaquinone biosynthesis protein [Pseudodesulfovibrio sp. SB368]
MSMRIGKIGYLNVLPIYHPLETGIIDNDFSIVSGPPSALNRLMDAGQLDVSAASSIEYARHPDKYLLLPDIAIGSRGPVQSVLLLSREPVESLDGATILVSAQTHTSAALLRVLLAEWKVHTRFVTGDATAILSGGDRPQAILCIGDEALNLRFHPDYPVRTDLGEAWRALTGLPFIFGVWIARRDSLARSKAAMRRACEALIEARLWGEANITSMCALAAEHSCLSQQELRSYFAGLVYDLGEAEIQGMTLFYRRLAEHGLIDAVPPLRFLP